MARKAKNDKVGFSTALLAWYDVHARQLPWRTPPGPTPAGPDPYRVWLSEVMLQQTTVATVTPRFERFLERWPTVMDLAAAPQEAVLGEWAGLGYYARARNLHACAQAVAQDHGGIFPDTEDALLALPGVGPYTAAAVAAIAFDRPATVVDGNVDRVMVRQFALTAPIKDIKADIYARAGQLTPKARAGDYAQALMDLGATICRPKAPQCLLCPVQSSCAAHQQGVAADLPTKPAKKARPTRQGIVYVGVGPDGAVMTERRPAKGLFGGMAGLPGSEWVKSGVPQPMPPIAGEWTRTGTAAHTLTHFHLVLTVMVMPVEVVPPGYFWTAADALATLPTVFRKAVTAADLG